MDSIARSRCRSKQGLLLKQQRLIHLYYGGHSLFHIANRYIHNVFDFLMCATGCLCVPIRHRQLLCMHLYLPCEKSLLLNSLQRLLQVCPCCSTYRVPAASLDIINPSSNCLTFTVRCPVTFSFIISHFCCSFLSVAVIKHFDQK